MVKKLQSIDVKSKTKKIPNETKKIPNEEVMENRNIL